MRPDLTVAIEAGGAGRDHLIDPGRQRNALALHARGGGGEAERVPGLERAEVPVVAPLHAVIDRGDVVADLAEAPRRVGQALRQRAPRELADHAGRGDQLLHPLAHVLDLAEALARLDDRLVAALGPVLAGARIEREHVLAGALVEAALGLVAEQAALDHRLHVRRQREHLAILVGGERPVAVVDDVRERVEADEIGGAEAGALGVTHRHAGQRVEVLGRQALLDHQVDRRHHRVGADAVRHEVGGVLGPHQALAHLVLAPVGDAGLARVRGVGAGHQLEELHVARRVEEVGHQEVLAEPLAAALEHLGDAQAAGVGRDDRLAAEQLVELGEQRALDVEPLDDRLDDQIAVGDLREIVVEVAGGDERGVAHVAERGRLALLQLLEGAGGDGVLRRLRAALGVGELGRHDVEEEHRDPGVGEVGGDAATHHAGAEDGDLADRFGHERFRGESWSRMIGRSLPDKPRAADAITPRRARSNRAHARRGAPGGTRPPRRRRGRPGRRARPGPPLDRRRAPAPSRRGSRRARPGADRRR